MTALGGQGPTPSNLPVSAARPPSHVNYRDITAPTGRRRAEKTPLPASSRLRNYATLGRPPPTRTTFAPR